ncbi:MAG: response regulator [Rhodohalobacter sp.]|uniref:response regulator transcription factor n=1 Tax=Rhodohalobacter sp. TaxID=1974210 RepID=UPI0039759C25
MTTEKKILLVEDDEFVRESITDLLIISGYNIDTAVNGAEGFEKISDEKPALVICDVMMPVMDGFQLLEKLITTGLADEIYFMFLSAKSREADMEKGLEMGANDYMVKPFRNSDLLNKVENIFT